MKKANVCLLFRRGLSREGPCQELWREEPCQVLFGEEQYKV